MSDTLRLLIPILATHVVALAVVLLAVKRVLTADAARAVERVRRVEADIRKKENEIRRRIEEHERDFEARKREAEDDLQRRRDAADKEVARKRDTILAEARAEAGRVMEQASRHEETFRQQLAQEMEEKAVEYSGKVVALMFTEAMAAAVDAVYTDELLDALAEIDSESITVSATDVAFTAARPLKPEQKARLESILNERFGIQIKVAEQIQEDIVAGLIFKLGSLEIDGSLRNRMKDAVEEVKKNARA